MTSHQTQPTEPQPTSKFVGLLAEFDRPKALLQACSQARDYGYKRTDAYSPFPVHGMEEALGISRTKLPFAVLAIGMGGALFAVFLQWYTNAAYWSPIWPGYDYIIGGKPIWSLPANIPVVFEVTVLSAAFATFFGMWGLNRLPRFAHPLQRIERFKRATSDRFFLMIEADDEKFDRERTTQQLNEWGAAAIESVDEDLTDHELPTWLKPVGICAMVLLLLPPVLILRARGMTNTMPRLHFNPDMDWQDKSKAQTISPLLEGGESEFLFADRRSMRPPVEGTIARGDLELDDSYYRGVAPETTPVSTGIDPSFVSFQEEAGQDEAGEGGGSGTGMATANEPNWLPAIPPEIPITRETLELGQTKFNTYCAVCHGYTGEGDGLVSRRATELSATQKAVWTPTRNLREAYVVDQPAGRIYDTITNGRGTMAGYKAQVPNAKERWAIVLYVRALQASEFDSVDKVPADLRANVPAADRVGFEDDDSDTEASEAEASDDAGSTQTDNDSGE